MSNLFEKSINMGFGLFAYSREKIESMVEELVNKGEIARKDAQKFASDLIKKGEEQREELLNVFKSEGISRKGDINSLKQSLNEK